MPAVLLFTALLDFFPTTHAACTLNVCYPGSTCLCSDEGCTFDGQTLTVPCNGCDSRGSSYTGAVTGTCRLVRSLAEVQAATAVALGGRLNSRARAEWNVEWVAGGGCTHELKEPDEHWREELSRAGLDNEFGFEWDE